MEAAGLGGSFLRGTGSQVVVKSRVQPGVQCLPGVDFKLGIYTVRACACADVDDFSACLGYGLKIDGSLIDAYINAIVLLLNKKNPFHNIADSFYLMTKTEE